jgi:hypothetical protein
MTTKEITDLGWRQIMENSFLIGDTVNHIISPSFTLMIGYDEKAKKILAIIRDSYCQTFFDGYLRSIDDLKLIMELTGINEIIENAKKSK